VACINVTNVSPPDQSHFLFANVARLLSQPSADREIEMRKVNMQLVWRFSDGVGDRYPRVCAV
jgi:hypothetical protein